ncbi:SDR family NAD(P)-dependent oxidoreductase [Amycolatopsis circi]|uniref:SDR family NAD(P)-dependent oxidoreductase n=1 Tax=Amycolatopsis circi TaxID=871959 RepID=UPI000E2313D7|nr:SDR family NAD(P)-dependent oxidoreductase [Amycolatopsis circi]
MRINHNTVAVVTGAASGLGLATAQTIIGAGGSVVVADLARSDGETVAKELGERAVFVPTDVTDEDDVTAAVDAAAGLGSLRVVVNCAGIAPFQRIIGKSGTMPLAEFRSAIDINLIGTFNVLRLTAAAMAAQEPVDGERGVIVCTASVAAFEGQIGQAAYAASKAGVAGLTLCAARDLADKQIRVVTVAPGIFETAMLASLPQQARDSLGAQIPHPSRLGQPAEYAALVEHIVENPVLNGEVIRIDGALRMGPR